MIKHLALFALTVASILVCATCVVEHELGALLFVLLASIFPPLLMLIGAVGFSTSRSLSDGSSGRGGLGGQAWPIGLLFLVLPAVMAGLLAFRGQGADGPQGVAGPQGVDGPWWGGLPAAVAILIYGLFLLPLLISSFGYALTFDRWGLAFEDLETLKSRFPRRLEADEDLPGVAPGRPRDPHRP